MMIRSYLGLIDQIGKELEEVEMAIRQEGGDDPRAFLLSTIPGMGDTTPFYWLSRLGTSKGLLMPRSLSAILV